MKWSWFGRAAMGLLSAMALGLGMTACGGGTIAYLWTIGQQHQQIIGFKVDDFTGNLTATQGSPYSTNGSGPVYILVKPGGRYVYVINQGTSSTPSANSSDSGIAVFSVGGDGSLTYQATYQSKGNVHLWAQFDSSGSYLFVLDRYSPSGDGNGSITAFAVDPSTGRLHVAAQTGQTPSGGASPFYVEVGPNPLTMISTPGCLFTLNQGSASTSTGASITPYTVGTGQLGTVTTGLIQQSSYIHPTSITGYNNTVVVTDAGALNAAGTGYATAGIIYPYTATAGCGLTPFTGTGSLNNDPAVSNPVYSFIDMSGKYLYVLNDSVNTTSPNTPYSQITAYLINGEYLSELSQSPFKSGSGPSCMVEDPTSKWMYVANRNDGTVTGYRFTNTQGVLSDLPRGSSFNTNNTGLQCLALSGAISQ